jgi:2-methylaconitate cis-trans-isomerase PrpF
MDVGTLLLVLLLLACPLMMVFMHRGGHGMHAGHEHSEAVDADASHAAPLDQLRSKRAEIDVEIAQLEKAASEDKSPAAA